MFDSGRDYWLYPAIAAAALAFGYGVMSAVQGLAPPERDAANAQVFQPSAIVRYQQTGSPPPNAMDKRSLARAIQTELARVGCYAGAVNGLWTPSTRAAMTSFVENANARLPTDEPDQALLSLAKAHAGNAACRAKAEHAQAAAAAAAAGVALVAAPATHYRTAGERPTAPEPEPIAPLPQRAPDPPAPPAAAPTPAPAPVAAIEKQPPPQSEAQAAAEARRIMTPTPPSPILAAVEPLQPGDSAAPLDAKPETYEAERAAKPQRRTARRKYRRNSSKPPKFVRSIVRNVNKTLSSFGF